MGPAKWWIALPCWTLAGCLSSPPGPPGQDNGDGGAPGECSVAVPPAEEDPDPLRGNRLHMSFDRQSEAEVIVDRSGFRHDGNQGRSVQATGHYGGGRQSDGSPGRMVELADRPGLFVDQLTVEAWILLANADVGGGILSDYHESDDTAELVFAVGPDNRLYLGRSPCGEPIANAGSTGLVPAQRWVHVAATWDGEEVAFYIDGKFDSSAALSLTPCATPGEWFIGGTERELLPLLGRLDELKLSDYVKTPAQIAESAAFAEQQHCGDGVLDPGEQCDSPSLCCNPSSCEFLASEACVDGVCSTVPSGPVLDGVAARYLFDENGGSVIADTSGSTPAVNLTIEGGSSMTWQEDGLRISGPGRAISDDSAGRLTEDMKQSNSYSIDLWLTPTSATVEEAVIVALGSNAICRSWAIVQVRQSFAGYMVSRNSQSDGEPPIDSSDDFQTGAVTHVVFTRDADGVRRIYINGRLRNWSSLPGSHQTWQSWPLVIGQSPAPMADPCDDTDDTAPWQGIYHQMVLYHRALSDLEVAQNYAAGPD